MNLSELVDPELLAAYRGLPQGPWNPADGPELRAAMKRRFEEWTAGAARPAGVTTDNVSVPGPSDAPQVRVRLHAPQGSPQGALLWIHGGGYVVGAPEQDDLLLAAWVADLGCLAVAPAYRLAPEHVYPAQVEDVYAAWTWLVAEAARRGVDPGRIGIGGSSAGGGLAASLGHLIHDRGGPQPAFQLLICPMLDDRCGTDSAQAIADARVWNADKNRAGWRALLGGLAEGEVPPYAAAARASNLSGLPPALVLISDLDPMLDEDIDYARRLIAAAVPTELHVFPRAYHGFQTIAPEARVSKAAKAVTRSALARWCGGETAA